MYKTSFFAKSKQTKKSIMEIKTGITSQERSYEDFEPYCKWELENERDILEIHLPDFKKEELKVEINNQGILAIRGEHPTEQTKTKTSRFRKEIKTTKEHNTNEIRAKFSRGFLYIIIPKKSTSFKSQEKEEPKPIIETNQQELTEKPKVNETETNKLMKCVKGVKGCFSKVKMRPATAVKVAAVVVVATVAVGGFVAYKFRNSHVENLTNLY